MIVKEAYTQTIQRLEVLKKEELQAVFILIRTKIYEGSFSLLANIFFKETLEELKNKGYNVIKTEFEFKNGQTIEEDRFKYRIEWLENKDIV